MRSEAYLFSIYCDGKDRSHHLQSWNHFVGKNAGRCRYQARKAGWKLSKNKKDLCPDCHNQWLADRKASRAKQQALRASEACSREKKLKEKDNE